MRLVCRGVTGDAGEDDLDPALVVGRVRPAWPTTNDGLVDPDAHFAGHAHDHCFAPTADETRHRLGAGIPVGEQIVDQRIYPVGRAIQPVEVGD